jgi:hypothetical protein
MVLGTLDALAAAYRRNNRQLRPYSDESGVGRILTIHGYPRVPHDVGEWRKLFDNSDSDVGNRDGLRQLDLDRALADPLPGNGKQFHSQFHVAVFR